MPVPRNTDEQDPVFLDSPAALISGQDVQNVKTIPKIIQFLNNPKNKGAKGDRGAEGKSIRGIQGIRGEKGADGKTPKKGVDYFTEPEIESFLAEVTPIKGVHYDDGYTPIKNIDYFDGEKGESIVGEKGDRGSDGKDGYTPVKNKDYFDGVAGKDGESIKGDKGDPGKDGKSISKEKIKLVSKALSEEAVEDHEKEFDHLLLHDPKLLGTVEVDERGIGNNKVLLYNEKKNKLVYDSIDKHTPTPIMRGGGFTTRGGQITAGSVPFGVTGNILAEDNANFSYNDSTDTLTVQNLTVNGTLSPSPAPVAAQYVTLATDATLTNERVLTGTSNQITVTDNGAGSTVVLSTPQNIHTAASPTFAGATLSGLTAGSIPFAGTGGLISQDNANFRYIDATNVLTLGLSLNPPTTLGTAEFGGEGTTNIVVAHGHAADGGVPGFASFSSRGTAASPTATGVDDFIGFYGARGYGATAYASASKARIGFHAGENWTDSAQGTYIEFDATPNGSTSLDVIMRLMGSGNVGIGETNPGAKLQVNAETASTIGTIVKAAASQTASLTEWQNSAGSLLLSVGELGQIRVAGSWDPAIGAPTAGLVFVDNGGTYNDTLIAKDTSGNIGYVVTNPGSHQFFTAGSSTAVFEITPSGVSLASITLSGQGAYTAPTGVIFTNSGGTANDSGIWRDTDQFVINYKSSQGLFSEAEHRFYLGDGLAVTFDQEAAKTFVLFDLGAGDGSAKKGLVIKGKASQSASLLQLQNSDASVFVDSGDGLASSEFVINEQGLDIDFRIEGDTDANLLFVDASTDRVGIGTNTPGALLDVRGAAIFNEAGADADFRIEGDTNANLFFLDASADTIALGDITVTSGGNISEYRNVSTTNWGVPAIYGTAARVTGQTAQSVAVATYTVGAADGSFEVSGNVNVTASVTHSFSLDVTYTDETNTVRTLILPMTQLGGSFISGGLITNVTGASPYESPVLHIRCKTATTITIRPSAGTYTSVTYNAEGIIKQIS